LKAVLLEDVFIDGDSKENNRIDDESENLSLTKKRIDKKIE
jgi:hypothetical protein